MAEINFNNLYNQLSPMDKRYYDQQFSKNYVPGQENIMLSSQPAYEQMKAVYEAQQQVPEKSFFDFFNFGEASAAEKPQVPNLTYRDITPTFDLATGITNTKAATPFINTADILNQYNVPGLQNQNLVDQIIKQNLKKIVPVSYPDVSAAPLRFATDDQASFFFPSDTNIIPPIKPRKVSSLGFDTSYGVASEPDVEQVESLGSDEPSGIAKLLKFLMPGSMLSQFLPKQSPEATAMKNFYGSQFGLTPTGQVASGIMQGYNPVSGGFLNMITGGKYGKPTQYGLAGAMQRRIENILGRKAAQTAASAAKVAELKKLQLDEMKMREKGGESLSSIGKSTFSGPGMAFAPKKDTFSGGKTKTTGGVPGGKYGSPK